VPPNNARGIQERRAFGGLNLDITMKCLPRLDSNLATKFFGSIV
jgi:hypothetical protein